MTKKRKFSKYIQYDLWRQDEATMTKFGRLLTHILKTIVVAIRGFGDQKINIRANHLTYSLLFAIVPIVSLVFAVAKGFGFGYIIDQQLEKYAVFSSDLVNEFSEVVARYIATTNSGLFIGIGLLILIGAVYIFFRNVELAFNEIWNVQQSRSILRQSVNYIAILFLIPVLVIVTSGLNIYLHTAAETWGMFQFLSSIRDGFINLIQFALIALIFTWMYMAIPNTKVRFISGLIPGVITALLLMGIEALSFYLIALLSRMSIVYGAFAFFPILLIIVKWLALIILVGAELAYAIQNNEQFNYHQDLETMSRRYKDFITIYILHMIVQHFEQNEAPLTAKEMASAVGIPQRQAARLLSRLEQTGLVREIYIEDKEERTFQPSLDTHEMTLATVLNRIDQQGSEDFLEPTSPDMESMWQRFIHFRQEQINSNKVLISDLCL